MNKEETQQKKIVVSFALDSKTAKILKEKKKYTKWIASLVTQHLSICPLCKQNIQNKAESDE